MYLYSKSSFIFLRKVLYPDNILLCLKFYSIKEIKNSPEFAITNLNDTLITQNWMIHSV